jgi:PLP dependent protein
MYQFLKARQGVLAQIEQACQQAQRNVSEVQLLAVSKTHPSSALNAMYESGQRAFGENYLQEALQKISDLKALDIEWHFIGHVQRNKTKLLAENFAWVHGVDRLIIAQRLSQQRPEQLAPINICIQVNIDHQDSKDGCHPDEVLVLVNDIIQLPNIHLRGLMVIPAPNHTQAFTDAKQLFEKVRENYPSLTTWDTLSMGMSGDLLDAIQAGSTMVRIGTALFGQRDYQ